MKKLPEIKKQWDDYNEEFDREDFMDIDTHTGMAMQVGPLITEVESLQSKMVVVHKLMMTGDIIEAERLLQETINDSAE